MVGPLPRIASGLTESTRNDKEQFENYPPISTQSAAAQSPPQPYPSPAPSTPSPTRTGLGITSGIPLQVQSRFPSQQSHHPQTRTSYSSPPVRDQLLSPLLDGNPFEGRFSSTTEPQPVTTQTGNSTQHVEPTEPATAEGHTRSPIFPRYVCETSVLLYFSRILFIPCYVLSSVCSRSSSFLAISRVLANSIYGSVLLFWSARFGAHRIL